MALKLYNESDIQDIADAIRGKNGSSDTYTVSQMASAIDDIPSGGGGSSPIQLLDTITVTEGVRAVNIDLTPYHSYDEVFIFADVTLSAKDWLYTVVNGSSPSGGAYTATSLVNHKGLFAYMGKLAGRPTESEQYTGYVSSNTMTWSSGYANNLYIYAYAVSTTYQPGSKFLVFGGNYADM